MKFGERYKAAFKDFEHWVRIDYELLKECIFLGNFLHTIQQELIQANAFYLNKRKMLAQAGDTSGEAAKFLQQWQVLNYLAVLKACKKHDKHHSSSPATATVVKDLMRQDFTKDLANPIFNQQAAIKTCPVCCEQMANPFTLHCQHQFCFKCLKNCSAFGHNKCPLCRHEQALDPICQVIDSSLGTIAEKYYPKFVASSIQQTCNIDLEGAQFVAVVMGAFFTQYILLNQPHLMGLWYVTCMLSINTLRYFKCASVTIDLTFIVNLSMTLQLVFPSFKLLQHVNFITINGPFLNRCIRGCGNLLQKGNFEAIALQILPVLMSFSSRWQSELVSGGMSPTQYVLSSTALYYLMVYLSSLSPEASILPHTVLDAVSSLFKHPMTDIQMEALLMATITPGFYNVYSMHVVYTTSVFALCLYIGRPSIQRYSDQLKRSNEQMYIQKLHSNSSSPAQSQTNIRARAAAAAAAATPPDSTKSISSGADEPTVESDSDTTGIRRSRPLRRVVSTLPAARRRLRHSCKSQPTLNRILPDDLSDRIASADSMLLHDLKAFNTDFNSESEMGGTSDSDMDPDEDYGQSLADEWRLYCDTLSHKKRSKRHKLRQSTQFKISLNTIIS